MKFIIQGPLLCVPRIRSCHQRARSRAPPLRMGCQPPGGANDDTVKLVLTIVSRFLYPVYSPLLSILKEKEDLLILSDLIMSLTCELSGEPLASMQDEVVTTPSGHVCLKCLLLAKLSENDGMDPFEPIQERPLLKDHLICLFLSSNNNPPRPVPPRCRFPICCK